MKEEKQPAARPGFIRAWQFAVAVVIAGMVGVGPLSYQKFFGPASKARSAGSVQAPSGRPVDRTRLLWATVTHGEEVQGEVVGTYGNLNACMAQVPVERLAAEQRFRADPGEGWRITGSAGGSIFLAHRSGSFVVVRFDCLPPSVDPRV